MAGMMVLEEQRGGVPTWSVLSLVALVDPDTSNSDSDLHKGGLVTHEITYPTPFVTFNIHAALAVDDVTRVQQQRERNSEE